MQRLTLRYLSDIHLEFHAKKDIPTILSKIKPDLSPTTVCICAGDISNPYDESYDMFMQHMSRSFAKTFVIAGNHEYYNKTKLVGETDTYLANYFKKFKNISYLNNQSEQYLGRWFIGTTLWSKITNPAFEINDVHYIPKFDYLQYNRLNMMAVDFLETELETKENCVVITHHIPSSDFIDPKYKTAKMRPYNQWFASDLQHLFRPNIKAWIYGHTHSPNITHTNGIQFACNPIGYPRERYNIDYNIEIEID